MKRRFTVFAVFFIIQVLCAKSISGFRQIKTYKYAGNSKVLHFEHEKTGAQLVYIQNEDVNRAFNIVFNTRAYDDVGLPHIFEHCSLAGSEKYPDANLFFQMSTQTYNTYMNASTYQLFTGYPMSSLSEKQLFKSLDVYMNGIFHPIVLTEEKDLKREAVRFVLDSPSEDISATGAVYNELKGVFGNKFTVNYYNLKRLLFPDSSDSYITGGKPEDILTVSWDKVRQFHEKYYTPSNMTIYLYGKLDYEKFLKYFDEEFLSKYEKQTVDLSDSNYVPWKGFKDSVYEFPASEDAETVNTSIFNYAFTLPDAVLQNYNDLRVLITFLSKDSSELCVKLNEKFPSAEFECYYDQYGLYPFFNFEISNINEEDKDELKNLIDEVIASLAENKIDKSYIELFGNSLKMSSILEEENPNGVRLLSSFALLGSVYKDPVFYLKSRNALMNITKTTTPESVQNTVRKYLYNSEQSAVLITKPVAGLAEKENKKIEEYFKQLKASMSETELEQLVKENKEYNDWLLENEKINLVETVKVVSAKDLPEEYNEVQVCEKNEDGIKIITGENPGSEYTVVQNIFSMDYLPAEYINPMLLYFSFMGSVPTKNHSMEELELFILQNIYSINLYSRFIELNEGGTELQSCADFMVMNSKLKEAFFLVEELLQNSDFSDYDLIRSLAARTLISKKQTGIQNPAGIASSLISAVNNAEYAERYYTIRFDFWKYLDKVSKMTDQQLAELEGKIEEGKKILFNKNGLTYVCIGDKKQISRCGKFEKAFTAKLAAEEQEKIKIEYTHKPLPKSIAVIIPGDSCFNYSAVSLKDAGEEYSGKHAVLAYLLGQKYLFQTLRFKYGSYGAQAVIAEEKFLYLSSYRDPHISNTFRVYEEAAEVLRKMNLTQAEIDGFITSIFSDIAKPVSKFNQLNSKISRILYHDYDDNKILRLMKETKSTSLEDIEAFAKLLENFKDNSVNVTVGGSEQIYAERDRFDLIITDYIK